MRPTPLSPVALKATGFFSKQNNTFSANAARERLKLIANEDQYGYWYTNEGQQIKVNEMQHNDAASRIIAKEYYQDYFKWVQKTDIANYTQFALEELGWIRVVVVSAIINIEIHKNNVSEKAVRSFSKNVEDISGTGFLLVYIDHPKAILEVSRKKQPLVLKTLRENIKKNTLESMDLTAKETKERITNSTILYHGTSRDFDKFSVTSERNPTTPKDEVNAIFFTDDPVVAYGHANRMRKAFGGKIRIIKVNLDFKNMYDATNAVKKAKKEFNGVFGTAKRAVYAKVDRNKFDGIAFRGDAANTPEYVVFNPDIIKILNEDVKLTAQEITAAAQRMWFTWKEARDYLIEAKVDSDYMAYHGDGKTEIGYGNDVVEAKLYKGRLLFNRKDLNQLIGWVQLDREEKKILEAAISEPYGYWITPKGELLKVENDLIGHIGVLQKYSKANNYGISAEDWETIDDADYWPVLSKGWIRIVFERFNDMGIEIAKKSVSPAAAKKLGIYIKGLKDKNFTIDINKSAGRYEIDYEDTTSKAKIISVIEQNLGNTDDKRLEASTFKHHITIAEDNEIIDHSVEETIETWRTDTGLKLVLVYNKKEYFIREFSSNNVLVNEQAWAFLETARQSLLGIVRLAQDSGVFFKRESEMTAADTVLQRWEASDKKYAIELSKSDTGSMAVSNFIKGDISQAWHKIGTSYLGNKTEDEALARINEDMNIYKNSNKVTFKKVKAASVEKPKVVKKAPLDVKTRTSTDEALPSVTETIKETAAQILKDRKAAVKKAIAAVDKGTPIPEALKEVKDRDRAHVKTEIHKEYAKRGMKDIKAPRIEPPPSEHDRRMVGSYVVGINKQGKPVRGMLLTQRKDREKRHYGWIAILNEANKPSRIEVTNITRTLTKPPKDLVKAYEYMKFKLKTTMSRS